MIALNKVDFPTFGRPTITTVGKPSFSGMRLHHSIEATIGSVKRYYPVYLDLENKPVLVVGAGKVALRKAKGLLEAGAVVTVVSPAAEPEFASLPVRFLPRPVEPGDLDGHVLVFTATNVRGVNEQVALAAKSRGIPVNVADSPAECDFLVPARLQRGDIQLAISTSGTNPRLAAALRRRLEAFLDEWGAAQGFGL